MSSSRTVDAKNGRRGAAALILAAFLATPAFAGPGAHGPDGEHLDAPAQPLGAVAHGVPRVEAHSEMFELVATLAGGELSILVDRYASNEPVLGAQVEVAGEGPPVRAAFRADAGDYVVTDKAVVQALARPGEHALVFTMSAGKDSDLLDGVLRVEAPQKAAQATHAHAHAQALPLSRALAILAGLGLLGAALFWWRRRRATRGNAMEMTR